MLTYPILLTQVDPYNPPPQTLDSCPSSSRVKQRPPLMVNKRMSGYIWFTILLLPFYPSSYPGFRQPFSYSVTNQFDPRQN